MAWIVPFIGGCAAATCVFGLLGVFGGDAGAAGPRERDARRRVMGWDGSWTVRAIVRGIGAPIYPLMAGTRWGRRCLDEWELVVADIGCALRRRARRGTMPPGWFEKEDSHGRHGCGRVPYGEAPSPEGSGWRGIELAREELAGSLAIAVLLFGVAGGAAALSPWGCAVGVAAPWFALAMRATHRARTERQRIEAAMPEAFAALAIALGSGHSLAQGMRFVGAHAQEPVKSEFLRVSCAIDCGVPAASALDDLLERLPAPGLGLVSLALKVSQRTGAPLGGLLSDAADMVGERIELARCLDVKTSQARMSARLVALMPIAMVAGLAVLSADFRTGLAMPVGAGSVMAALALNGAAWIIIRRMMEVDDL